MGNRVTQFEIQTKNHERTKNFYEKVFDWKFKKSKISERYWLIKTGDDDEGIDGGMMLNDDLLPNVMNIIHVDDFYKTLSEIKENGGEIVIERLSLPKIGYLAYFKDPDGNCFGVLEKDESAE